MSLKLSQKLTFTTDNGSVTISVQKLNNLKKEVNFQIQKDGNTDILTSSYDYFKTNFMDKADVNSETESQSATQNIIGTAKMKDGSVSTYELQADTDTVKLTSSDGREQIISTSSFQNLIDDKHVEIITP